MLGNKLLGLLTFLKVTEASLRLLPDEVFGGFEFVTPRYSTYIGNFDTRCDIVAPASILSPAESLCDLSSVFTPVNGTVLFQVATVTLDCYAEEALANAESLGALALVDVLPITPGSLRYSRNLGQPGNQNSIPFVQTGTEFLGGVLLNPDFPVPLASVQVSLQGCNDDSIWDECYDIQTTAIQVPAGLIALLSGFHALSRSKQIQITPASQPRIFVLRYLAFTSFVAALIFIFGYFTAAQYSWLTADFFPDEALNAMAAFLMGTQVHSIFLTGIYWQALSTGLFKPEGRSTSYWRAQFYMHPLHLLSYPAYIASVVLGYIAIYAFFTDPERFEVFAYVLFAFQTIVNVFFVVSGVSMVVKLRKFVVTENQKTTNASTGATSCWGMWLNKSTLSRIDLGLTGGKDNTALRYTVFLSRSLFLFAAFVSLSHICFPFLYIRNSPVESLQGEMSTCRYSTLFATYNLLKLIGTHALVLGLGWIPKKSKITQKLVSKDIMSDSIHSLSYNSSPTPNKRLVMSNTDFPVSSYSLHENNPPASTVPVNELLLTPSAHRPSMEEALSTPVQMIPSIQLKIARGIKKTRDTLRL